MYIIVRFALFYYTLLHFLGSFITLHPGQKKAFLAKQYSPPRKNVIRVECHPRRWGKTLVIILDAFTYQLAYPNSEQIIIACNKSLSDYVEEEVGKLLQKARMNPEATIKWPFIVNDIYMSGGRIMLKNHGAIHIIPSSKINIYHGHNPFDRVLIDDANYISDTISLSQCIAYRKKDGELLLMASTE